MLTMEYNTIKTIYISSNKLDKKNKIANEGILSIKYWIVYCYYM